MNKIILTLFLMSFLSCYNDEQRQLDEQKKVLDSINNEIFNLKKQIQYDKKLIEKIHSEQSDTNNFK